MARCPDVPGMSSTHRNLPVLLAGLLSMLLVSAFAAACGLMKPADPFSELRESWSPGFSLSPAALDALPAYSISVRIDPEKLTYLGSLELALPVSATQPLAELYFRTYPNLYAYGGSLTVTGARVNDVTVNFAADASGTAVRLVAPHPLPSGEVAQIWLAFSGKVVPRDQPGVYTIFGFNEGILCLPNFYPILAGRRGGEWALDVPHPQGDVGFHDAALYRVEVTIPQGQVLAATGTEITRTINTDGWVTARYALGPAREFSLLMSSRYQVASAETLGVRVHSYYLPEDAEAGRSALHNATAALQIYSDRFGSYPYRDMAVVEAPLAYHGMEFPGVNLIGSQVYSLHVNELETLVVHEVAHQWWYNQVGSDQVRTPWLDEGLAEFSMYYYTMGRYGEPDAKRLRTSRWELPVADLMQRGGDAPIGLPVRDYKDNYETVIYAKGALFFAALRDEIGPDAFLRLLHVYLERYRWCIATPEDFKQLAEEVSGRELEGLFAEWVGEK